jgi:peroxiredoxin
VDLKTFDPSELEKKGIESIEPKDINTSEFFENKTVVVFTITGAFTPVVSRRC